MTLRMGVAVEGDRVCPRPGHAAAEADVDLHGAEEMGHPLEAVERLLHEGG
jgi:hypothetical protein